MKHQTSSPTPYSSQILPLSILTLLPQRDNRQRKEEGKDNLVPADSLSQEIIGRVEAHFPDICRGLRRILQLFGPHLEGIACQVDGRAAVVDAAWRLVEHGYLLEGRSEQPSRLPYELEGLFNRVHIYLTDLSQEFTFLSMRPQARHNCLLHFCTDPAHLPFLQYMGGPALLYLLNRHQGLVETSQDANHSLTSVLQPARDLAEYFATHRPPTYHEVWNNEELGWELVKRLELYFKSVPNRQVPGQPRAESTIQRDIALTKAMLALPYIEQRGRSRLLVRHDYRPHPTLFPDIFVPFDDGDLPEAAWEPSSNEEAFSAEGENPVNANSYHYNDFDREDGRFPDLFSAESQEDTTFQNDEVQNDAGDQKEELLAYSNIREILKKNKKKEEIKEKEEEEQSRPPLAEEATNLEREKLPRPQLYARLNHLQDRATLEQNVGRWDSGVIPPLVLGLALVAPFATTATNTSPASEPGRTEDNSQHRPETPSNSSLHFLGLEELPLEQLERLVFLELALTTGRDPYTLLQMVIRARPPRSKEDCPDEQLVYVPVQNTIYTAPQSLRGLPKVFREQPDSKSDPQRYSEWLKLVEVTHRAYRPAHQVLALALHSATRQLVSYYYRRRFENWSKMSPLAQVQFFPFSFSSSSAWSGQTTNDQPPKPRELEERVLAPIKEFIAHYLPLEPPLSFSRLRKTAWNYLVGVGGLGPALAHFESGQLKPELNARLHYAGIDRATFEAQVNAAQQIILKELAFFQAEAGRAHNSSKSHLPELTRRLAPVTTTQEVTTAKRNGNNNEHERLLSPHVESVSAAAQTENIFYGTGFCPYAEMLKALTGALLQDYARLPNFYRTSSSQLEQLSYNSLVYLCAYLTMACCGTRKSELILTSCSSIDLQHQPPLITLNGKRDLFNTEPRTLPLPQRLRRLWEVVLHIRNLLIISNTCQQAASRNSQSLYIFPEPSSYTDRSRNRNRQRKSHREVAPELLPLTAPQLWHFLEKAAIRLQLRDFLFRFQSFRQNLWFFLKQRGAPEEVVNICWAIKVPEPKYYILLPVALCSRFTTRFYPIWMLYWTNWALATRWLLLLSTGITRA